jgi:8-oxo-dGTP pyrophosphatase MutT (NUDIX family)
MSGDLPFDLLVTGHWRPGQVRATWTEDSRPHIKEVEQAIERAWSAANAQKGKKLFDGPMCRLEQWNATPDVLELILSPTSYRIFFGTNLLNPKLADQFGKSALANATGLSAGLMTSDGFLMLGRRNESVAYYPGRVHPFAGSMEPGDAGDVFAAMQRELGEELNIKSYEIQDIHCAAIAEDRSIRHPELILPIFLSLTREQIEARLDAAEHETCRAIPLKVADLERAIGDGEMTPIAAATVWIVRKQLGA